MQHQIVEKIRFMKKNNGLHCKKTQKNISRICDPVHQPPSPPKGFLFLAYSINLPILKNVIPKCKNGHINMPTWLCHWIFYIYGKYARLKYSHFFKSFEYIFQHAIRKKFHDIVKIWPLLKNKSNMLFFFCPISASWKFDIHTYSSNLNWHNL